MTRPKSSLIESAILLPAAGDAFAKLDPRHMVRNPVMYVVEIVAALATLLLVRDIATGQPFAFELQIVLWLWATVLFATCRGGRGRPGQGTSRHPPPNSQRCPRKAYCDPGDGLEGADARALELVPGQVASLKPATLSRPTAKSSRASHP